MEKELAELRAKVKKLDAAIDKAIKYRDEIGCDVLCPIRGICEAEDNKECRENYRAWLME